MKIYIDNYKPIQLLAILSSLEKYFHSNEEFIEIISETGQFHILKDKIYHVFTNDLPIINKKMGDFNLILDKSTCSFISTTNIPNSHISNSISRNKYSLKEKNPFFFLVVEGYKGDQTTHFIPSNFYFEFNEEKIDLENCIEDLNEFLFILNKY